MLLQYRTWQHGSHLHLPCCADRSQQDNILRTVDKALRLLWLQEQHADSYPLQQVQVCMCEAATAGCAGIPVGQGVETCQLACCDTAKLTLIRPGLPALGSTSLTQCPNGTASAPRPLACRAWAM